MLTFYLFLNKIKNMNNLDLNQIQKKWQKIWEEKNIYSPKVEKNKEKFYITAAYPYPNSPQHIGHARTYTIADIMARFNRMCGKNVLFPMGFHVSGTPIFGMAKRIEQKDKEIIKVFKEIYGIDEKEIEQLSDPKKLVYYFSKEIQEGMKNIGYSIDWTRKFYTFDEHYTKFIRWQFLKLNQLGLLEKGSHPVPWCPKEGQAIGAHDVLGDIEPEIEKVLVIFFYYPQENIYFPTLTYRPDTLPGVSNIWINENASYIVAKYNDKEIVLSKIAFELLKEQLEIELIKSIDIKKYLDKEVINPLTQEKIPIFSAKFVKEEVGTGIVMSVPAHAPYDYVAVENLDPTRKQRIKIKPVIKTELGQTPAKDLVIKHKIKDEEDKTLEELTKQIYAKEAHAGVMVAAGFEGLLAKDGKEKISNLLKQKGLATEIYTLANAPIYSRAHNLCTVKIVKDQWFINYGLKEWKEKAKLNLERMKIIPAKLKKEFEYTIDWLERKACTRAKGFGTKFPLDENLVIEALSDSTIYMAYYTISHITKNMDPNELDENFFDYVFLGKKVKNPTEQMKKAREEFLYWYPLDSRNSAIDLVHNHLTFFIFNHVAIFEQDKWPKQIVANGLVMMEGSKMSKSLGNILPLKKAIEEYGSDVIRFAVSATADIDMACDFYKSMAQSTKERLNFFYFIAQKYKNQTKDDKKEDRPTKWFYSKFHKIVQESKQLYEELELKKLSQKIFYDMYNDLNKYLKQTKEPYLREFLEYWTAIISPIMPFVAQEIWQELGKKYYLEDSEYVSFVKFPKADSTQINIEYENQERYLDMIIEDINEIKKLAKIEKPNKIKIIVYGEYKEELLALAKQGKELKQILKIALENEKFQKNKENLFEILNKIFKDIGKYKEYNLSCAIEYQYLIQSIDYIKEFTNAAQIEILKEEECPQIKKAKNAMPLKPAIILE